MTNEINPYRVSEKPEIIGADSDDALNIRSLVCLKRKMDKQIEEEKEAKKRNKELEETTKNQPFSTPGNVLLNLLGERYGKVENSLEDAYEHIRPSDIIIKSIWWANGYWPFAIFYLRAIAGKLWIKVDEMNGATGSDISIKLSNLFIGSNDSNFDRLCHNLKLKPSNTIKIVRNLNDALTKHIDNVGVLLLKEIK